MRLRIWLAATLFAMSCAAPASAHRSRADRPELFYHIFVRSFSDSDGDRNGDLNGIRDRLTYLQELGVTTLLLTPLYPSHFYHNYFADDFEGVDGEFGTMSDFANLVKDVHARGMKIFLDEEIQYVSGHHAWRTQSHNDPTGPYGRFLLYADARNERPIATLFGSNDFYVWPDQREEIFTVNLKEPKVRAYFGAYLKTWIDPNRDGDPSDGVDGFRIDHMMDDLDGAGALTDLLASFWAPLLTELRAVNPKLRIVAEQADWGDGENFFAKGKVDMVFAFPIWRAAHDLNAADFVAAIDRSNAIVTPGRDQIVFVENHDTERFAEGVRRRPDIIKLGAAITLLTGWTPSIYYGQELGMSGAKAADGPAQKDRPANADAHDIPLRQAFRWTEDPMSRGAAPWYRAFPSAYSAPDSNVAGDGVSVEEQRGDPNSTLSIYRTLTALRARHPALAHGGARIAAHDGSLAVIERRSKGEAAMILFNFGAEAQSLRFALPKHATRRYGSAAVLRTGGKTRISAPPYSATVWTVRP